MSLPHRTWKKDGYVISTDSSVFPLETFSDVINSDGFYWSKKLSEADIRKLLENSLCFGLYKINTDETTHSTEELIRNHSTFVGIARCITDNVTFVYVDDVWVQPPFRGKGLGNWLLSCVKEVIDSMPHLRHTMLHTGDWERSVPFYEGLLGLKVTNAGLGQKLAIMDNAGPGLPDL